MTPEDVMEIGKQTLRDQLAFNEKAEFSKMDLKIPSFVREESIEPTDAVFDVDEAEVKNHLERIGFFPGKRKSVGSTYSSPAGCDAGRGSSAKYGAKNKTA